MILRGDMLRLNQTFNFTHVCTRSASDSHQLPTRSLQPACDRRRWPARRALGSERRQSASEPRMPVKRLCCLQMIAIGAPSVTASTQLMHGIKPPSLESRQEMQGWVSSSTALPYAELARHAPSWPCVCTMRAEPRERTWWGSREMSRYITN